MSHYGEHNGNYHNDHQHGGTPSRDNFFRGHRFSQWASRMERDLADVRDPQPNQGNVYGSPVEIGGSAHQAAEIDLGATAVAAIPELRHPQDAAWEQRFANVTRANIPH